jgi:hypothetical protein
MAKSYCEILGHNKNDSCSMHQRIACLTDNAEQRQPDTKQNTQCVSSLLGWADANWEGPMASEVLAMPFPLSWWW